MNEFLEAMKIFMKYLNDENSYSYKYPFHCEHDLMYFYAVSPLEVSFEDHERLDELGFVPTEDREGFVSYKYGSC